MVPKKLKSRFSRVKCVLLDVDGVLTDGRIIYDSHGRDSKFFDVHDGLGVSLLGRMGVKTVLVTAKGSECIEPRAKDMRVDAIYKMDTMSASGSCPKTHAYELVRKNYGLADEEICFVGDDLVDLCVMHKCGLPVATANAVPEVKKAAAYITKRPGGRGAVREVAELILRSKGLWGKAVEKFLCFLFLSVLVCQPAWALVPEAPGSPGGNDPQQMQDFNIAGYDAKGGKTWEVKGDSMDMVGDDVKMSDITAYFYGQEDNDENMVLTADHGQLDKASGKVRLKDNVKAVTGSGAELTTSILDWSQKEQLISTDQKVNISKDKMQAQGTGMEAKPDMKVAKLQKDVTVTMVPEQPKQTGPDEESSSMPKKMVITCDGPMELDYEKQVATFEDNVCVDSKAEQGRMVSDRMTVFFNKADKQIEKIVAEGHVKIVRGEDISFSDTAVFTAADKRMVMTGRPRIIMFTEQGQGGFEGFDTNVSS